MDRGVVIVATGGQDTLPLIIKPKNAESSSLEYMKEWISDNQSSIHEYLLKYGTMIQMIC